MGACRAFVLFCRDQGVFAAKLVSIDGAKFRAAASQNRVLDRRRIAEEAERIDARVAQYLAELDEGDAAELGDSDKSTMEALAALKTRRAELNRLASYLEQDDRTLVVEGELDARPMGFGRGGKPPSYNIQIAVDADTGLIIYHAVTDEVNDLRMLHPVSKAVKELLDCENLTVVADTGYSNGNAAAACEADNITACVPVKRSVNNRGNGDEFERSDFIYNADDDSFTCPAGRVLARTRRAHPRVSSMYRGIAAAARSNPVVQQRSVIGNAARPRRRPRSDDSARRKSTRADAAPKMFGGTSFRDNETDDDGTLSPPAVSQDQARRWRSLCSPST